MTTTSRTSDRIETTTRAEESSEVWGRIVEDLRVRTNPALLMTEFAYAFNRHDAAELAQLFATDAVFVNIFGQRMHGRAGIEEGHRAAFGGRLKPASMTLMSIDQTPVGPDVTILRAGWALDQDAPTDALALVPPGTGTLTAVARRTAGTWILAGASNVRDAQPPS